MAVKADELRLWQLVCCAGPDEDNLRRLWPLASSIGMCLKRCEYLCHKWYRQGKCMQYGTYTIQLPEWK